MSELCDRIKEIRARLNLTQEQLGEIAGVSKQAVAQWEAGTIKNIRNAPLFEIQKKTGFNAEWIATGRGKPLLIELENPAMQKVRALVAATEDMTEEEITYLIMHAKVIRRTQ